MFGNDKERLNPKNKKDIKKIAKYTIPFIPHILIIFGILYFVGCLILYADVMLDKFLSGTEVVFNFIGGEGAKDNQKVMKDAIDQAAGDCSGCLLPGGLNSYTGLDKEILYATINNQAIISNDVYSDDEMIETGVYDTVSNPFVDKLHSAAFYDMKKQMLGTKDDEGTMIYSLIGLTMDVKCVDEEDYDESKNIEQFAKYIFQEMMKEVSVNIKSTAEVGKYAVGIPLFMINPALGIGYEIAVLVPKIKNIVTYAIEGSNKFAEEFRKEFALSDETTESLIDIVKKGEKCSEQGKKPQYTSTKTNNYEVYYNYIKKIYVPSMYYSVWSEYSEDRKEQVIRETWADIVNVRNYSSPSGFLYYTFNDNGTINASVIQGGFMSEFLLSDPADVALTWKQGRSFYWANNNYAPGHSMRSYGCLITSIAKLIRLSGTQINGDSFDPWILAQNSEFNGGNMIANTWYGIAPNFSRLDGPYTNISIRNSSNPSAELERIISNNGHVADNYYYTIYIEYYIGGKHHEHFIAIVGKDENGFLLSDPAYGGDTYYLNDIASNINNTVVISGYQVYEKKD